MVAQSGEGNKIFHLSPSLFEGDGNSTKKDRKKMSDDAADVDIMMADHK